MFAYFALSLIINRKTLDVSSSLSKVKSSSPPILTMNTTLNLMYRNTAKSLNLFLTVPPDKIAKVETSDQKSLQDLLCFFTLFIQLSLSSSHILADASFFTSDL